MVFGMGSKKKRAAKRQTPSRSSGSISKAKPALRQRNADQYKDSARARIAGQSDGCARGREPQRRGIVEAVGSSARSFTAKGAQKLRRNSMRAETILSGGCHKQNSETSSIRVTIRFRPLSGKECERGDSAVWRVDEDNNVGRYHRGNFSPKYRYDTVFNEDQDNEYVYSSIAAEVVETAMSGMNGTVFAYGVTSSGKTHTMMGNHRERGMVPQAIQHVFDLIEQNPDKDYLLRLSMLEIYNEELNDLLNPHRKNLKVREDKKRGVQVEGLTERVIESPSEAFCLISDGTARRSTSATAFNEKSSRSHTLCRLSIEVNDRSSGKDSKTRSYLNLIDLAGSESARAAKSKGHRMEGSFINKSLLTLGTVIHKLSEAKKKSHIPYRDSKLTRLLQSSLSGNGSKMAIVCCVTPASSQAEETENTLKFAERAKKVKIRRSKNEIMDSMSVIAQLKRRIAELEKQLKDKTDAPPPPPQAVPDPALQHELAKVRERLEEELHARMKREDDRLTLEARIKNLTRLILHSTRAQSGNMCPTSKMHRSHSFDALKAKSAVESLSHRCVPVDVIHPETPPILPPEVTEMKSFSSKADETSPNPVNAISPVTHERRTSISTPSIRSPTSSQLAVPGSLLDKDAENDFLRGQLNIARQSVAEREKELAIRNRESMELKRRLSDYENSNPQSSRSHASGEDANRQSLEYSLLEADRGILEQYLSQAQEENEKLSKELREVRHELLKARTELKRRPKQHDDGSQPSAEQLFRAGGSADNIPLSPTDSVSTAKSGWSDNIVSAEKTTDERPPRCPRQPVHGATDWVDREPLAVNPTELREKLGRLEAEVRCALHALSIRDNQIESQKKEIVSQKEEAEEVKQLLHKLGSENESLKQQIKMLEAQQNRMQGYLLDTMPTTDLYALRAQIKDACHRLERAAYSRRISSIPALSFDELDTESTQDIYVSKLESLED